MNRRNFIGALIAAPAIVRASSLMPVTRIWTPTPVYVMIFHQGEFTGWNVLDDQWLPEQRAYFMSDGRGQLQISRFPRATRK